MGADIQPVTGMFIFGLGEAQTVYASFSLCLLLEGKTDSGHSPYLCGFPHSLLKDRHLWDARTQLNTAWEEGSGRQVWGNHSR